MWGQSNVCWMDCGWLKEGTEEGDIDYCASWDNQSLLRGIQSPRQTELVCQIDNGITHPSMIWTL